MTADGVNRKVHNTGVHVQETTPGCASCAIQLVAAALGGLHLQL